MKNKGYNPMPTHYKRLDNGRFSCVVCGTIHPIRFYAQVCCKRFKPFTGTAVYAAEQILADKAEPLPCPRIEDKPPDDGITHPDRNGHWYRGKKHSEKGKVSAYYQAQHKNEMQYRKEQRELLKTLISEFTENSADESPSPLRRLAYAFHLYNWEMVKNAAYNLAETYFQSKLKYILREFQERLDTLDMEIDLGLKNPEDFDNEDDNENEQSDP